MSRQDPTQNQVLQILKDNPGRYVSGIALASTLPYEGTFVIDVTNFDPVSQNTVENKQHIINLYSRIYENNKDIFETDGSWCNIRTGVGYSTGPGVAGFKFLAAARGLAPTA
ncbi:MAG: hypothetical protein HGB17_08215 [Syntrophobacteraceae bacterium]|nr:hypothetical protein [Syntrophobacteraceae bacterium]